MPWNLSTVFAQSPPRATRRSCRTAILLATLGLTAVASRADNAATGPHGLRPQAKTLTNSLVLLGQRQVESGPAPSAAAEARMRDTARQRRQVLRAMLANDPGDVFGLFIPPDVRERLPASVKPYVEQRRVVDGTLVVTYVDREGDGSLLHVLKNGGKRTLLRFQGDAPSVATGTRVRVSGVDFGGELAVERGDAGVVLLAAGGDATATAAATTTASTTLPHTLGEQRTLVLLANFQDDTSQPLSVAEARELVFTTVSGFFRENSQGQTWLSGDTYGWFTLPLSRSVCGLSAAGDAADVAATQAGIDLSAYERIIYLFSDTACSVAGMGEVGAMPSRAYIDGIPTDRTIAAKNIAHELGHNFGLYHSRALDCGDVAVATNCDSIEYGDTYDTMGNPDFGHYNAFQKERLGWLTSGGSSLLTQVDIDGARSIAPYETAGTAPKVLKVPGGIDSVSGRRNWFYVEYRQATGYDSFLAKRSGVLMRGDVTRGVVVHMGTEGNGNSSRLLHMNLASPARQIYGFTDWFDPALKVGSTFWDGASGVGLTTESADGTTAVVRVAVGDAACVASPPEVTVSPSQATGPAGTLVSYTVTVVNHDGTNCPAATFNLASTAPAGWTAQYAESSVTLSPGASTATVLRVTSSAASPAGLFDVVASARSAAQSTLADTAVATYLVESASVNSAPVANDDTAATSVNVAITIPVLANDSDPEGQVLRVTAVTQGSKGQASVNADGTVTYRPYAKVTGQDRFTYTITDGTGFDTATVSVQIGRRKK